MSGILKTGNGAVSKEPRSAPLVKIVNTNEARKLNSLVGNMEKDIHTEVLRLINAVECNNHEKKIIHSMVELYGFNSDSMHRIRKTVRAEVARRLDSYIYATPLSSEFDAQ